MISIVIVNWNSGPLLENCVRSLLENAAGCQVIIVDNASADSSLRFTAGIGADLTVLINDRNAGYAAGNNLGWRASQGTHILFLNPDTECLPGSVDCLSATLAADETVWAAGGHLVSPSGQSQQDFHVRDFPSVAQVAADMLFLEKIRPPDPWLRAGRASGGMAAVDVDQPAGACLMVARTALESLGGFDEAFAPAWFEDVDLCRRIRNQGGRIQHQPAARFLHHGGYSLGSLSRQDFLTFFHTNQIRYFRKHFGPKKASSVRRLIILGLFLRSALSIVHAPEPGALRTSAAKVFLTAARRILGTREVTA